MMEVTALEEKGFAILKNIFDEQEISHLIEAVSKLKDSNAVSRKNNEIYGVRNLLNHSPEIRELSQSRKVRGIAKNFLGKNAKVVRAIYFDKTLNANWKVPWHQDLMIAVVERRETKGFSAWTRKAGIQHVQPPIGILEKMLTLRFHLDDSGESNGALKVVPKSHNLGRLSADEIKNLRKANSGSVCNVKRGDCLVMRPLLIHSSSAGLNPKNRRVIHLEFSADDLPNGLQWYGS